jgi:hypothetical protein
MKRALVLLSLIPLFLCGAALAQTSATAVPTSGYTGTGWTGGTFDGTNTSWENPGNLATTGSTIYANLPNAECDLSTCYSPMLEGYGFGFSIPSNATIKGVSIAFQRWQNSTGTVDSASTYNISLCSGSGCSTVVATKSGLGTQWQGSASMLTEPYGNSTDTWGATLTPTIINGATFGFGITVAIQTNGGDYDLYTNSFTMTVYYTTPPKKVRHSVIGPAGLVISRQPGQDTPLLSQVRQAQFISRRTQW